MSKSLKQLVEDWLGQDENPTTRSEIQSLWDSQKLVELESRLRVRIQFGTAGLRGRMEAGWSRMNDLIVIQTSQGLCTYVLANIADGASRGVVVGHDHRHHSERWARLTAAIFVSFGVKVYLLQGLVHTPMVPFSVKELGAACGVMITASHNPKQDNGYKVYWENGVQIIGPHDTGIAQAIMENLQPRTWDTSELDLSALSVNRTEVIFDKYFARLSQLSLSGTRPVPNSQGPTFVNTSLHGVSDGFAQRGFEVFGFQPFIAVEEQREPDPEFPTVAFPNPEEKGALDLAIRTADSNGARYILAQDPDADRFSAAEKGNDGVWTIFTGDQLGTIFGCRILDSYKSSGKPLARLAIVASAVSSKMLEAVARDIGFRFAECLTGFKYIGNTALDLVREGYDVPFGYEEAIGFMFGPDIRDKDGIAATVLFAELVYSLHQDGRTVKEYLAQQYKRYGYFETSNSYFVCHDSSTIEKIFHRLRKYQEEASYPSYPQKIAGLEITRVVDLTTGYDTSNPPTFKPSLPLSSGHMIQFRAQEKDEGLKINLTIRTSGTEPKIKYYLEGNGKDAGKVSALLPKVVKELGDIWLEAKANVLLSP